MATNVVFVVVSLLYCSLEHKFHGDLSILFTALFSVLRMLSKYKVFHIFAKRSMGE